MSKRMVIGAVTAVTGVLISLAHLLLMGFSSFANRYHWMEFWVVIGFILGVVGLLILTKEKRN